MQKYFKHRLAIIFSIFFWLSIAITSVLLLIELKPDADSWQYKDKLQHIFSFFSLAMLGFLSYPNRHKQILVGLSCYGLLMEVLQGLITVTRTASLYDWLADCVGLLLALIIMVTLKSCIHNVRAAKAHHDD